MKIQTETRKLTSTKLETVWVDVGDSWRDVIEQHWRFIGLDKAGFVLMAKDGYINKFRQID